MIFLNKFYYYFSSRDVVFNAIKRLTQRTEKFITDKKARESDMAWIEKKLTDGKFRQIRDISKSTKPTPTKDSTPLSPKRPVVLDDPEFFGRGKRSRVQRTPCKNAGCTDDDCESAQHHSLLAMVSQNYFQKCSFFSKSLS